MTFDPFGDFATRGYPRNLAQEQDTAIVRRLEHASFTTGLDDAFAQLAKKNPLTYADVLSSTGFCLTPSIRGPDRIARPRRPTSR